MSCFCRRSLGLVPSRGGQRRRYAPVACVWPPCVREGRTVDVVTESTAAAHPTPPRSPRVSRICCWYGALLHGSSRHRLRHRTRAITPCSASAGRTVTWCKCRRCFMARPGRKTGQTRSFYRPCGAAFVYAWHRFIPRPRPCVLPANVLPQTVSSPSRLHGGPCGHLDRMRLPQRLAPAGH